MGEELTESDLQRVKELGHQTSKDESEERSESSVASEAKTDDSNREESKEETSESAEQASGSASGEDKSTSTGDSSSEKSSESKSPLVKWQSPDKTSKLECPSNPESGEEISPCHQAMRPPTATGRSMGSVLKEIGKKFIHETPKKIIHLLSPKSKKGEEASLATSSSDQSACGKSSSSKEAQFTIMPTEPRDPLHAEVTGQQGGFLPPRVRMTVDSANESTTELTSISSISFADEAFQSTGHASVEAQLSKGSIQDAASLDVDFEEIPSPSKRAKLQTEGRESSCEGMATSDCSNPSEKEEQSENMSEDSEE